MSATPIAREGAHAFCKRLWLCLAGAATPTSMHSRACLALTERDTIEARDASAVEVERTLAAFAESMAKVNPDGTCGMCGMPRENGRECSKYGACEGAEARAALARVASLKGGAK